LPEKIFVWTSTESEFSKTVTLNLNLKRRNKLKVILKLPVPLQYVHSSWNCLDRGQVQQRKGKKR
jgi:hypothetical protein